MITLTLFDNKRIVLNADLIEFVEGTPDTLISLTDGKKVMVKETVEQVVDCVVSYKRRLCQPLAGLDDASIRRRFEEQH